MQKLIKHIRSSTSRESFSEHKEKSVTYFRIHKSETVDKLSSNVKQTLYGHSSRQKPYCSSFLKMHSDLTSYGELAFPSSVFWYY